MASQVLTQDLQVLFSSVQGLSRRVTMKGGAGEGAVAGGVIGGGSLVTRLVSAAAAFDVRRSLRRKAVVLVGATIPGLSLKCVHSCCA